MKASVLLSFTLGTLSAIGGFIDIGDLVADAQGGARFGLRLAWVTCFSVVGIMCFSEMAGRIAIQTQRPAFGLARSRMGPRYALVGLVGAFLVTALLVMAELSGVALALELATSLPYLLWVPVAATLVLLVFWLLPFERMERIYGLLGLSMLVFVVAVFALHPDWSRMLHSATSPAPVGKETWATYAFFVVTLIGAQMTPYEMFFFSSGPWRAGGRPRTSPRCGSTSSSASRSAACWPSLFRPLPTWCSSALGSMSSTSHRPLCPSPSRWGSSA